MYFGKPLFLAAGVSVDWAISCAWRSPDAVDGGSAPPPRRGKGRRVSGAHDIQHLRGFSRRLDCPSRPPENAVPTRRTRARMRTVRELFDLAGSVALVTGGGRGLGE